MRILKRELQIVVQAYKPSPFQPSMLRTSAILLELKAINFFFVVVYKLEMSEVLVSVLVLVFDSEARQPGVSKVVRDLAGKNKRKLRQEMYLERTSEKIYRSGEASEKENQFKTPDR